MNMFVWMASGGSPQGRIISSFPITLTCTQAAGFRRAPAQIKDIKKDDLSLSRLAQSRLRDTLLT